MTNNDDSFFEGTVSVLDPMARPTPPTSPLTSKFVVNVSVPTPAAITDLTAFMEVTDTALADLKIVLTAPGPGGVAGTGPSITLVENQNIYVGTSTVLVSNNIGITGTSMGIFDYSPGPPTIPGVPRRDCLRRYRHQRHREHKPRWPVRRGPAHGIASRGGNGLIGHWRPESEDMTPSGTGGVTLAHFLQCQGSGQSTANGHWRSPIKSPRISVRSRLSACNSARRRPRARSTRSPANSSVPTCTPGTPVTFPTVAVLGALGNVYTAQGSIPAAPNTGVGPDLVMAMDNTLGPDSPYQGQIYAAFVGYFNVSNPPGAKNPTTNTDIFLVYSVNGGASWSSPELINEDQASTDGFSGRRITISTAAPTRSPAAPSSCRKSRSTSRPGPW